MRYPCRGNRFRAQISGAKFDPVPQKSVGGRQDQPPLFSEEGTTSMVLKTFVRKMTQAKARNLALSVLCVPNSLDPLCADVHAPALPVRLRGFGIMGRWSNILPALPDS